jgi:hypothetical protein
MPHTRASIECHGVTVSRITHIPSGLVSVLPEGEINDHDPTQTQVQKAANDPDDDNEDEDEDDSTLQEGKNNRSGDDIL